MYLVEDSHKFSSLNFSEKQLKLFKNVVCCSRDRRLKDYRWIEKVRKTERSRLDRPQTTQLFYCWPSQGGAYVLFFGDFIYGVPLFIVIFVIYKYKNR